MSEGWKTHVGPSGTSQRTVGPYGVEALNAGQQACASSVVPGLLLERDLVRVWPHPKACRTTLNPEQSQSRSRVYTSQTEAHGKKASPGLLGFSLEQGSGREAQLSWRSQGRRHSHPEPFIRHREEGPSAEQTRRMSFGELRDTVW